jgi:hypothetical protein
MGESRSTIYLAIPFYFCQSQAASIRPGFSRIRKFRFGPEGYDGTPAKWDASQKAHAGWTHINSFRRLIHPWLGADYGKANGLANSASFDGAFF